MEYEINFLVLQSRTETVEKIREQVKSLIKEQKGSVTDELIYKKRKLAYEIKHEKYGFFTVLRFNLKDNSDILNLKRELNLLADVARYIIVKSDELPELNKEILSMEKRERKVVKQEEVEKMIAKSEETTTEKKVVEKKEEVKEEKKEEAKEEKVEEEKEEVKEEEKEEIKEEVEEEVKEEKKEEKKEDKKKAKSDDDKEDKSSLEDLDKKLDEILSI